VGAGQSVRPAESVLSRPPASDFDLAALADGAVVVCYAPLVVPGRARDRLVGTLNGDETARARAFLDPRLGRRFAVGRGTVRVVLARYLGIAPAAVRFGPGPNGKPHLDAPHVSRLDFNISHSGDRLAIAATKRGSVGIDIERLRPMPDAEELAEKILSANEIAVLANLPKLQRERAFLVAWVRKEACLKAAGAGFSMSPTDFDVLTRGETDRGMRVGGLGADDVA